MSVAAEAGPPNSDTRDSEIIINRDGKDGLCALVCIAIPRRNNGRKRKEPVRRKRHFLLINGTGEKRDSARREEPFQETGFPIHPKMNFHVDRNPMKHQGKNHNCVNN
jgi:hypothetical protein